MTIINEDREATTATVQIRREVWKAAKHAATEREIPLSRLIEEAIEAAIEKDKRTRKA